MNTAQKVIAKFGGQTALARLIGKRQSTVGYWARTGVIPAKWQRQLLDLAQDHGVGLSPDDFFISPDVETIKQPSIPVARWTGTLPTGNLDDIGREVTRTGVTNLLTDRRAGGVERMVSLGIDAGSLTTKLLLLEGDTILSYILLPTGEDVSKTAAEGVSRVLEAAGLPRDCVDKVLSTGVGKNRVPCTTGKPAAEARCDVAGARFYSQSVRGVINVGAETSRVVKCDPKGSILDFATNDKCAAGTGVFLGAMAKLLRITPEEMAEVHEGSQENAITSTCVVFAESEVVSLIHKGNVDRLGIWREISYSIAKRIYSLVTKLRIEGEIVLIGGVAKNLDFVDSLEEMLGYKLLVPPNPELVCALGAAIIAQGGVR